MWRSFLILGATSLTMLAWAGPGATDTSFAPKVANTVNSIVVQPDGRILVGGMFTSVNNLPRNRVARLFADGSTDTAFLATGSGVNGNVNCMALQPDGRLLIAGDFISVQGIPRQRVARLNPDGSLDGSFTNASGPSTAVACMALQPDGKVLIGGSFVGFGRTNINSLARLNTDGSLDLSFNPSTGIAGSVNAVAVQADGKVIIGGLFSQVFGLPRGRLARLQPDGAVDLNFMSGLAGASGPVRVLAIRPDGKILAGGDFATMNSVSRPRLAQLHADGTLDAGFSLATGGFNNTVYALRLQTNGSVLVGGDFSAVNSIQRSGVARLYPDGTPDSTFMKGAVAAGGGVRALDLQPEGSILVGGLFTTVNAFPQPRLARIYGDLYPPEFISQPHSSDTGVGASVLFYAAVSNPTWCRFQWRKDGEDILGANYSSYSLGNVQPEDAGLYSVFVSNEAGGTTSSNAVLRVGVKPLITAHPSSLTVTQGQTVRLVGAASGTPLALHWLKNGTVVPGATNALLEFPAVAGADSGVYALRATNFLGTAISASAFLNVLVPPTILAAPASRVVGEGSNTVFSVVAEGTSISFQWLRAGVAIEGATNMDWSIENVRSRDEGVYAVTVSNVLGAVTSEGATLAVQAFPPEIAEQPGPQSVPIGQDATFVVRAWGTTLSYQWMKDGTNLPAAAFSDLTVPHADFVDVGGYQVVVANTLGSVTSVVARLEVGYAPVVVEPPASVVSFVGGTAALSCVVTGSVPVRLQWLLNGRPVPGETNSSLLLSNLNAGQFGVYALTATNAFGGTQSLAAELSNGYVREWKLVGSLAQARRAHTATLMPDGSVLVIGGTDDAAGPLASMERFDPATDQWTAGGALSHLRMYHTATLLSDGRLLVVGGHDGAGALREAEIYDPVTHQTTPAGSMMFARYSHAAWRLADGRVLVAGGWNQGALASSEVFDPAQGTWNLVGDLNEARCYFGSALLPGGQVMVAAGLGPSGDTSSAEIFDPAFGLWQPVASCVGNRRSPAVALLTSGEMLLAGGLQGVPLSDAQLYVPASAAWITTGPMVASRGSPVAVRLPNDTVLVAGGWNGASLPSSELYDPAVRHWFAGSQMNAARNEHTLTLLPDGRVLAVGGMDSRPLASAEAYSKKTVQFSWGELVQVYDGTPRSVRVATIPAGVPVDVTYNGATNPPVDPGSYEVVARVRDLSFAGLSTNTLTVIPAVAPITIRSVAMAPGGVCRLHFSSGTGLNFVVVAADELPLATSQWSVLGAAREAPAGSGDYEFSDPAPASGRQKFYRVRTSP